MNSYFLELKYLGVCFYLKKKKSALKYFAKKALFFFPLCFDHRLLSLKG